MKNENDLLNYAETNVLLDDLLRLHDLKLSPERLIEDCQHAQRNKVNREVPFLQGEKIKGRWQYKREDVVLYVQKLEEHHKGFRLSDIDLDFSAISNRTFEAMQASVELTTRQIDNNQTLYSGVSDGVPLFFLMANNGGVAITIKQKGGK